MMCILCECGVSRMQKIAPQLAGPGLCGLMCAHTLTSLPAVNTEIHAWKYAFPFALLSARWQSSGSSCVRLHVRALVSRQ